MVHVHLSMQSIFRFFMAVVLAFGLAGLSTQRAAAAPPDTTADLVYGQGGSMTTSEPIKGGLSAASLFFPIGVAVDGSGGLYVADMMNNRVLYIPAGGTTATRVYGQGGSFTSSTANNGGVNANSLNFNNNTMSAGGGVVLDGSGNLYVADTYNNRVLYFTVGSTTATRVYGQGGDFTTNTSHGGFDPTNLYNPLQCYTDPTLSANSLNHPYGLALDGSGNLYVADTWNSRVLYYPAGTTTATRLYGQGGSYTSCLPNDIASTPNADSLALPMGLALDGSGDLYVADTQNNRVLHYPAGSTTAEAVYGQGGSFTSTTANNGGVSANSLNTPSGLAADSSGNLYVSDTASNRVLYYPAGSTTATAVYGQGGSLTSNTNNNGGISANSLADPFGLALDSFGSLFVADTVNNRVLKYYATSVNPGTPSMEMTGNGNPITNGSLSPSPTNGTDFGNTVYPLGTVSHTFTILNSGTANLNLTDYALVTVSGSNAGDFSVTVLPSTPIGSGFSWTTFTVQFAPSALGTRSAVVNIGSDDSDNNPFSFAIQGTGVPASRTTAVRVYGQGGSMTTGIPNNGGLNAASLYFPIGVAVDGSGGLYVAEDGNNRVLYIPSGSTAATRVYGQGGSFTSSSANNGGVSANSLNFNNNTTSAGGGVVVDSSGNLYVADTYNNRVLYFTAGSTTATRVYGQGGDFTTNTSHGGFDPTDFGHPLQCYTDPTISANQPQSPNGPGPGQQRQPVRGRYVEQPGAVLPRRQHHCHAPLRAGRQFHLLLAQRNRLPYRRQPVPTDGPGPERQRQTLRG